ncbi:DUF5994 family protein [Streptomyces sp. NBC_01314]|uniref:DUF5994 family protein n=1 Tax=Streptomyces sp. NBC_01314 TaxID=2903821 RepID=UPI00352F7682
MSATTPHLPPRPVPFIAPSARLALKSESPFAGATGLDGAWWPRSRDLPGELSALADVLDPLWGRITRIAVNPRHWPALPSRIVVNGHVVKVGWFTSALDPHAILLLSYTAGRWNLLVIPPGDRRPLGRPADGRRECGHRPADDRDRAHDGGTGPHRAGPHDPQVHYQQVPTPRTRCEHERSGSTITAVAMTCGRHPLALRPRPPPARGQVPGARPGVE